MIYMRGQREDYDLWRQSGDAGWRWDAVLPLFKRSEDHLDGAFSDSTARGGEWRVEAPGSTGTSSKRSRRRAREAGIPQRRLQHRRQLRCRLLRSQPEAAACAGTRPRPSCGRWPRRRNLTVTPERIVEAPDAQGRPRDRLALGRRNGTPRVAATREVVLAAGAINSPQLLELSGIGGAPVLQVRGIDVVHRCPASARTCRITCSCAASTR